MGLIEAMSIRTDWSAAGVTNSEQAAEYLKAKRERARTEANELQANRELFQSKLASWLPESDVARDCPTCSSWQTPQNIKAVERANTIEGLLELYEMDAQAQKLGSWALETLGWKQKVLLPLLDDFCQRYRYGGSPVLPEYSGRLQEAITVSSDEEIEIALRVAKAVYKEQDRIVIDIPERITGRCKMLACIQLLKDWEHRLARKLQRITGRCKLLVCVQLIKDWKIDSYPTWISKEITSAICSQEDLRTATLTTGIHNKSSNNDKDNLTRLVIKEVRSRMNVDSDKTYSERIQRTADDQNLDERKFHEKVKKAKDRLTPSDRLELAGSSPWAQDAPSFENQLTVEKVSCKISELIKLSDLFLLKLELDMAKKHLGIAP